MAGKKILVVDDSALIRKQLGDLFDRAGYDVGLAKHGQDALEFIQAVDFDVVTMDINMPVMDGLTAVKEIMRIKPTPIVMVSSLTQDEADITFEALEAGAVDYVPKPGTLSLDLARQEQEILQKVAAAAAIPKSRLTIRRQATQKKMDLLKKKSQPKVVLDKVPERLVLIGASTGGPGLIEEIVTQLPGDYPYPVCIVQHMPENFTGIFAKRLDKKAAVEVVEARQGDKLVAGKVIIGKGGRHLHFTKKASGHLAVKLVPNTMNHFFCPSVDEMFCAATRVFDPKCIMAVELTGIGDDGADCMVKLRQGGAYTLAESEQTAVVYGMPKEAWERGGAVKKLPFPEIVKEILTYGEQR
ncbi:MAG TPA: chemotaxis-specific protein-glutamate methyltransferase CheB [Piscirickettsiaceae bacterium]|nr:chemotaxis-specific protein-glutamate methyltransferase CheB [Piscirickettsiaceae bacterium]HIQ41065.1 chemotaxis-specific protein-glutamate methyltransferase CheB [Sulfurivirga caldicuralii]